jgi:hypothetical protein
MISVLTYNESNSYISSVAGVDGVIGCLGNTLSTFASYRAHLIPCPACRLLNQAKNLKVFCGRKTSARPWVCNILQKSFF